MVLPPLIYVWALAAGFSVQSAIFAALLGATVLFWVFGLVDEFVPALVAVVATLIIGLAPPERGTGRFRLAESAAAARGVRPVGRDQLLRSELPPDAAPAAATAGQTRLAPGRRCWARAMSSRPLMPSANARLSLLTPVFKDMAAGLQLPPRGPAITALLAAMFGGALLFSPMMATSKSSNIAALSLLPPQVQTEFGGFFWLVAAASCRPGCDGDASAGAAPAVSHRRRATLAARPTCSVDSPTWGRSKPQEWIAAGGFVFFLSGSATTGWHHVKPPYLAGCVLLALLLTGALLRKEFQRELDWPMIFFLLGIDSLMRIMNHLGLAQALARAVGHIFDFVGGRIGVFILVALAVTLAVRLALPVTAGMLTAAIILLPVAAAQGIHPWICVFCAAIFSDIAFFRHQGTNGIIQIRATGLFEKADERGIPALQHADERGAGRGCLRVDSLVAMAGIAVMRLWKNLLIAGFLLAFVLLLGFFNATKPRILVLHSGARDRLGAAGGPGNAEAALKQNRRPVERGVALHGVGFPTSPEVPSRPRAEARRAIELIQARRVDRRGRRGELSGGAGLRRTSMPRASSTSRSTSPRPPSATRMPRTCQVSPSNCPGKPSGTR